MRLTNKWRNIFILIGLYLLTASIHIIVISQQGATTDETFQNFRHLRAIEENGKPLFSDALQIGRESSAFNPLLFYLLFPLWFLAGSLSSFLLMIGLLVSASSIFIYLFLQKHEENKAICFLFSFISVANPLVFGLYIKGFFISTLYIPIIFLFFFCFFSYAKKLNTWLKITILILLSICVVITAHAVIGLFVLFLLFVISTFEKRPVSQLLKELYLYLGLLFLFSQYVIYHSIFLKGSVFPFFSQTILQTQSYDYFFTAFAQIVLPFLIIGLYAYYRSFRSRTNPLVLFSFSLFSMSIFLFSLKINDAFIILVYAFAALVLTAPYIYHVLERYWKTSKFSKNSRKLNAAFLLFFIFFAIASTSPFIISSPSAFNEAPDKSLHEWVQAETSHSSLFFISAFDANEFMFYTNRSTFVDTKSFETPKGIKNLATQTKLYETLFTSFAIAIINENNYGVAETYIIWDDSYVTNFEKKPLFLGDSCFPQVYMDEKTQVYRALCLEEKNG